MKKYSIILGSTQLFIAAGAIPAGLLYLIDPSGSKMGTPTEMLVNSPFSTFLIPGLFLLIINGFANVAGAVMSFKKNPYAGIVGIALGLTLCVWIIFQIKWIGFNSFLQPLFLLIGIFEAVTGLIIIKLKKVN